jgi:molecular chaperone DnaJ
MAGEGELGQYGGPPGDLYIIVNVKKHPVFTRKGNDIICEATITFPQAVLGTTIEVPTLDGTADLKIPPGTPSGRAFHLKGKGIPRLGGHGRGDEVVIVSIEVPKHVTQRQRELLEEFASISGEKTSKTFKDKLKDIFAGNQER